MLFHYLKPIWLLHSLVYWLLHLSDDDNECRIQGSEKKFKPLEKYYTTTKLNYKLYPCKSSKMQYNSKGTGTLYC